MISLINMAKAFPQNDQVSSAETTELLRLAEECLALPGDFVELGCYRGDTSVLLGKLCEQANAHPPSNFCQQSKQTSICQPLVAKSPTTPVNPVENLCKTSRNQWETCGKNVEKSQQNGGNLTEIGGKESENSGKTGVKLWKRLWIYDSFAGLPAKTAEDASGAGQNFQAGELAVTKREVVEKIRRAGLHGVVIKKAWFDELTAGDLPEQIAFAFCDGDLYGSIKTSLRLVLPRLAAAGIIVVHDYNNPELPGSARAVDEFLRAHPEFRLGVRHSLAILRRK